MENYLQRYVLAGGIMMALIIPTSIIAVALIIHGLINLRREKIMPSGIDAAFRSAGSPPSVAALREQLERSRESPLRRVCLRLLPWVAARDEQWDMTVQQVTSEEVAGLYQRHGYLAVVYGVAPLMGLLGTILGMIRAFTVFGLSEDRSIGALGEGIAEALITTMWGLLIAVPALLFLSVFRQKIYRYENELIPARARALFGGLDFSAPKRPRLKAPAPSEEPALDIMGE